MRPRPDAEFDVTLTDEQLAHYREQGYLSIDRITSDEEVEWLREVYDHLFSNRVGEEEGAYFDLGGRRAHGGKEVLPQVLGPERVFPELRETSHFRNARRLSAALMELPLDDVNGGGHMILKPAGYGGATPWHQDEAYWSPAMLHAGLSVWLPLDPATLDSGCLHFIPKSHLSEDVLEHRHI
ncbi:phytanoyl-CoA dioxygenase family protein, partial [Candidatus Poribacteria bacterium]|nr:phytanoyl-CoA dioxygenase family protein [Candidatus Poribacteria bacterium]